MAIVKVYAVRNKLHRAINYAANEEKTSLERLIGYAANPDKTEQRIFESVLNCNSVETAFDEMVATKRKYSKEDKVLAYHYIQSFSPGELTPELAHSIGVQFAKECFGDRFEVVIGTHLDRKHLHNHIVVNSVSFLDGGKFRSTPKSYYNVIRKISDRLCIENELSVIDNPIHKGMHYAEWKSSNDGKPTIRSQVREELDEIIKSSYTMQIFWKELERRGYTVHRKGNNIKYTSIIPPFGKRPIRIDKLGNEYTEKAIQERIIAERNGIRTMSPSQQKKVYKYNGNLKKVPRKKLKGFQALYFHYLYLFKKIRKKQTPQRVSFFMRDEIIKFERYQKQFKFLHIHGIENAEQLQKYQTVQEQRIEDLTVNRKKLYTERDKTNEQAEIIQQISKINDTIKMCRADVRMCKAIFSDANRVKEKYNQAQKLQTQAMKHEKQSRTKEVVDNELKWRSR